MLTGIPQFIVVLVIGVALMSVLTKRFNALERRFLWLGFFAHVVGTGALLSVVSLVYQGGDMGVYQHVGLVVADRVLMNPGLYGSALIDLLLGGTPAPLSFVYGAGSSTGSMVAIAAIFCVLWGDAMLATSLALSFFAFGGQVGFYLAFRANLPTRLHRRALLATMLVPSVVFWTSGLVKETIAIGALGFAVYALTLIIHRVRIVQATMILVASCAVVGLIKAYILFPLSVAGGVWFILTLSKRGRRRFQVKGWHVALGIVVSVLAISFLGTVYEQYAFENIAEDTARLQGAYRTIEAGSTYELGDPAERTFVGQLQYAPIGLVSALFRPFIFEVHNATSFINAIETTAILVMLFLVVRRFGIRGLAKKVLSSPFLIFLVLFVLLFATAIGLAAPNLGTLSRYRVPVLPAYWLFWLAFLPMKSALRKSKRNNVGVIPRNGVPSVEY